MSSESRYLETLKEMLRAAEARNDPTLAIAVSPRMLRLLLTAAGVLTPERPADEVALEENNPAQPWNDVGGPV